MRVFVAYSRPRGIHGRFIFTISIYYLYPTESAGISVSRQQRQYGCTHCGEWATITTTSAINPPAQQHSGTLEFFRYDTVEPGDFITIYLRDSDLLFNQVTTLTVTQGVPRQNDRVGAWNKNAHLELPKKLYEFTIIDWDRYMQKKQQDRTKFRIEEELIQQTMNAEPITIKELLLAPPNETPAIEGTQQFIEGQLRYLT